MDEVKEIKDSIWRVKENLTRNELEIEELKKEIVNIKSTLNALGKILTGDVILKIDKKNELSSIVFEVKK